MRLCSAPLVDIRFPPGRAAHFPPEELGDGNWRR